MTKLVRDVLERLRRRADHSEEGDTLVELLIAIVIIALTVTALLGGLVTAITSSTTQQSLSTVDSVLNTFAQSAQYEAQQSFVNCTLTPYRLISAPIPVSGPVGAEATVFVTGFAAKHTVTVTVGTATATTVSGNGTPSTTSTDANGDATVTFIVPNVVTGPQNVAVSDGVSTTSPTPFEVGGTTKATTPSDYHVSVGPVQQWNAQPQGPQWVTASSGTCADSGAQQIMAYATGPSGSSGTLSFVVLHSATTTILVSTSFQNPVGVTLTQPILGSSVTFVATLIPPNSSTPYPTGSVQWTFSQSPGSPSCLSSSLSNILGTNESEASCTVNNAQVGTYNASASYPASGCTNCNYGPGSGSGSITVGEATSSTVLNSSSSPSPAMPGSTLTFAATIGASPANGNDPQPTGTVVWMITPPSGTAPTCDGQNGGKPSDTQQLPSTGGMGTNSTSCSFVVPTSGPTGTYSASAVYQGDGNYDPSQSTSPATIGVSKATPTLSFSTSPQSPQLGSSFTVTVMVNGNGGISTQGGSLSWTITPPSGTAPACATVTSLPASEQATCTVTSAVLGTYTVAASYSGNGAYNAANGSTQVAVTLTPAGLSIATTGNPADNRPDGATSGGDKIFYTYNQAMSLTSVQTGLTLNNPVNVTAVFSRSNGATSLTINCTTGVGCRNNLGTVSLGDTGSSHYIAGGTFGGTNTVDLTATLTASTNAAGDTVITVMLTQTSSQVTAVTGSTSLSWTPSNAATNPSGVACLQTVVTETGSNF